MPTLCAPAPSDIPVPAACGRHHILRSRGYLLVIMRRPMTSITTEFWKLESDNFHDEVAKLAKEEHQKEVQEWELWHTPKTLQQFHQYVI